MKDQYKSVCIQSDNPNTNIYDYCDKKLENDLDAKKVCKLDMCNLCCSTMDTIKKVNFSVESMKKCFQDCSEEFNK